MSNSQNTPQTYDAVVVGAGVAGLYSLYRLREDLGKKVICFETGSNVGGTWYWNRYPGARTDSQCMEYQYWFSKELLEEWDWSERYVAQPESERYLQHVAEKFDLYKDIRFNTRVDKAVYDEANKVWHITTDNGDIVDAQHFVCCVGMLSAAAALETPFPGKENFKGMVCHTARWPKQPVDFTGKRVGVVGTGATGIQVIQSIAGDCKQLTVFQRTPNYTIAMRNPELNKADNDKLRAEYDDVAQRVHTTFGGTEYSFDFGSFYDHTPEERRAIYEKLWKDGSLKLWVGSFQEEFLDDAANAEMSAFVREKMRESINDPELADKLIPEDYAFGNRRVPLNTGYLEAFNRDNVDLIDVKSDPIECITEKGLKLASGKEYEMDILVLATGFAAGTGAFTAIDIHGRGDKTLKDKWNEDVRSTLGLQVSGFPNLFTVGAPLAPSTALCNMYTCLQQQSDWIADAIGYMGEHGYQTMEPTQAKEDAWVQHHDEIANTTIMSRTASWYTGANVNGGKVGRLLSYIGGNVLYEQQCDELTENGYEGFDLA
ncbi:MAG: NAD(P)/FAD-dependent oxidoreductase [Sinobacteraceae bacterium]|nr:NAD(P)/FAD-dependent oxidoreductase [Nevskiaceae bacterium]